MSLHIWLLKISSIACFSEPVVKDLVIVCAIKFTKCKPRPIGQETRYREQADPMKNLHFTLLAAAVVVAGIASAQFAGAAAAARAEMIAFSKDAGIDPIITGPLGTSKTAKTFIEDENCLICGDGDLMKKGEAPRAAALLSPKR